MEWGNNVVDLTLTLELSNTDEADQKTENENDEIREAQFKKINDLITQANSLLADDKFAAGSDKIHELFAAVTQFKSSFDRAYGYCGMLSMLLENAYRLFSDPLPSQPDHFDGNHFAILNQFLTDGLENLFANQFQFEKTKEENAERVELILVVSSLLAILGVLLYNQKNIQDGFEKIDQALKMLNLIADECRENVFFFKRRAEIEAYNQTMQTDAYNKIKNIQNHMINNLSALQEKIKLIPHTAEQKNILSNAEYTDFYTIFDDLELCFDFYSQIPKNFQLANKAIFLNQFLAYLNEAYDFYSEKDFDSFMQYLEYAISFAIHESRDSFDQAVNLNDEICEYFENQHYGKANKKIEYQISAIDYLSNDAEKNLVVCNLNKLIAVYISSVTETPHFDRMYILFNEAIEKFMAISFNPEQDNVEILDFIDATLTIAEGLKELAKYFKQNNLLDSAKKCSERALNILKKIPADALQGNLKERYEAIFEHPSFNKAHITKHKTNDGKKSDAEFVFPENNLLSSNSKFKNNSSNQSSPSQHRTLRLPSHSNL